MIWPLTLLRRAPPPPPEPTLDDVRREQMRAAQFALLTAEAELERATSTVSMLQARVDRLESCIPPSN